MLPLKRYCEYESRYQFRTRTFGPRTFSAFMPDTKTFLWIVWLVNNWTLCWLFLQWLQSSSSPLEYFLCSVLDICHEFTTSPYLEQSVISEPEQSTQAKAKFTIHLFLENPEQYWEKWKFFFIDQQSACLVCFTFCSPWLPCPYQQQQQQQVYDFNPRYLTSA